MVFSDLSVRRTYLSRFARRGPSRRPLGEPPKASRTRGLRCKELWGGGRRSHKLHARAPTQLSKLGRHEHHDRSHTRTFANHIAKQRLTHSTQPHPLPLCWRVVVRYVTLTSDGVVGESGALRRRCLCVECATDMYAVVFDPVVSTFRVWEVSKQLFWLCAHRMGGLRVRTRKELKRRVLTTCVS